MGRANGCRNCHLCHFRPRRGSPPHIPADQLAGGHERIAEIRNSWETHRSDPDSREYYAYYAIFLDPNLDKNYVDAMRLGERIEPENALYNINLAIYYLDRGIQAKLEKPVGTDQTDTLLDRAAFEAGIAELRKAVAKPYMRTYQSQIMGMKLDSLPQPRLTEDYICRLRGTCRGAFPELCEYRNLARKIPGCARISMPKAEITKPRP